jgi:hypothetical protein
MWFYSMLFDASFVPFALQSSDGYNKGNFTEIKGGASQDMPPRVLRTGANEGKFAGT